MVLASSVFFLVRCSWRATRIELDSYGCWDASVVLASADFSLLRHSWLRHGVRLASSGCCVANVVLVSAVFSLVHPLTRRQAEQPLEFLGDLVWERHGLQDEPAWCERFSSDLGRFL